MKISIKCRFTYKILFEGEYESTRNAVEDAAKRNISLSGSDLSYSDLSGSDLRGSDLSGSDLRGSNLSGSDLSGEKLTISPLQIIGFRWNILVTPEYLKIGCQRHKHSEWKAFKRTDIAPMASNAWDWWKEHKDFLMSACELHRKQSDIEVNAAKEKAA